jgi:glycosyltransferase involved in cell wall biosynthesis
MEDSGADGAMPQVSVVVPVHNGARFIGDCVTSLTRQTHGSYEVIVVDDGSTDDTAAVASRGGVAVVRIPHSGRAAARNAGLRRARGQTIVFAEDDGVYPPSYLVTLVEGMVKHQAAAAIGPYYVHEPITYVQKCRDLERRVHFLHYTPFSAWAYDSTALEAVGGYDENCEIVEDVDLGRRFLAAGHRIAYVPEAVWYHREPARLAAFIRRRYRAGKARVTFRMRYGLGIIPWRPFALAAIAAFPVVLVLLWGRRSVLTWAALLVLLLASPSVAGARFLRHARSVRGSWWHAIGWCYLQALGWVAAGLGSLNGMVKTNAALKSELMGR